MSKSESIKKRIPLWLTVLVLSVLTILSTLLLTRLTKSESEPDFIRWAKNCSDVISSNTKDSCWEDVTRKTLGRFGVDGAFKLISYLYDNDPDFARPCHAMVHIIGQAAYSQFRVNDTVPLSDKTAYCAFGFYHGFMETLIARKGTIDQARRFCTYVDTTLGNVTPAARFGCYHGIGHGATDVHNPKYFGDERALVASALPTCEAFARAPDQLKLCATGVFDSIALAYYNGGENGLVMKKDDPLWLCHEQPAKYKESCYLDMMPAVIWLGNHDLVQAAPIVFAHVEEDYKTLALTTVAENSIRFIINKKPLSTYVTFCRSLDNTFHLACIEGLSSGVMQFGTPSKEYESAITLCRTSELTAEEKNVCMKKMLNYSSQRYSKAKVAVICDLVEEEYKKYCQQ